MTPDSAGAAAPGRLVIGSRRSRLARVQSEWVGDRLIDAWPGLDVAYVTIETEGDRDRETPLPEIGGKGLFTRDLELALGSGAIDLAVHSLKDLPTDAPGDDTLAAIPIREDPRDVLVLDPGERASAPTLDSLPAGLRIGTSSIRRAAQLRRAIERVIVAPVRGNVETRLARVSEGDLDGVVLAAAGLARLGLRPPGSLTVASLEWPWAPGQGALALQGRPGDARLTALCAAIHHGDTATAVTAERSLLERLGGGCHLPVAARATVASGRVRLYAAVFPEDPDEPALVAEGETEVAGARSLGTDLAKELLDRGADAWI